MNITAQFPSRYLRACDLPHELLVTMDHVAVEQLDRDSEEQKPILYFASGEMENNKGLVLNKTNARTISEGLGKGGDETDTWAGKRIVIFATTCPMKGKTVDCIRVRMPTQDELEQNKLDDIPY